MAGRDFQKRTVAASLDLSASSYGHEDVEEFRAQHVKVNSVMVAKQVMGFENPEVGVVIKELPKCLVVAKIHCCKYSPCCCNINGGNRGRCASSFIFIALISSSQFVSLPRSA